MGKNKVSLYEIAESIQKIEEMDNQGELEEYLEGVKMSFNSKVDNILMFRRTTELTIEAIKSEEERLAKLRKSYENRNKRLKNYLSDSFIKLKKDKYESSVGKISFRKSKSIEVEDLSKIPQEFLKEKRIVSVDKKQLKEAIKRGKSIEGASLVEKTNIIIK